jgi:hypothetical protein
MMAEAVESVLVYWAVGVGLLRESVVRLLLPNNPNDVAYQTKTGGDQKAIMAAEEYDA